MGAAKEQVKKCRLRVPGLGRTGIWSAMLSGGGWMGVLLVGSRVSQIEKVRKVVSFGM